MTSKSETTIDRSVPAKASLAAIAWMRSKFGPLTTYQLLEVERRLDATKESDNGKS